MIPYPLAQCTQTSHALSALDTRCLEKGLRPVTLSDWLPHRRLGTCSSVDGLEVNDFATHQTPDGVNTFACVLIPQSITCYD